MVADTYSSDGVGVLLMGTGNDNNTWGGNCNTNVFQILADALANTLSSAVTGGTLDLSGSPPPAASSQARYAGLIFTGVLLSNQLVQIPNFNKWWLVKNATSGSFTLKFKTSGGSASTAIPQNSGWQLVRCDGSNVIEVWPFNTAQIQMPDGTVSLPAYANLTEPSSGWYRAGTQDWRLSINGVAVLQATGTGASSPSIINVLSPNALQVNGGAVASQNSVFKASDGTVGAPSFTFNSGTTDGQYRIGANNIGFAINGVKVADWSATAYTVTTKLAITNATTALSLTGGATGSRNGSPTAGDTRYNTTLNGLEYWNGTVWIVMGQQPTVSQLTNTTPSQTYTSPAGVVRHRVTMWAPGGGACAQATNAGANGSANTSFQVNATGTAWTAVKGNGGGLFSGATPGIGGAGGTGGTNGSTGTLIDRVDGGDGDDGDNANNGSDFGAKSGAHGGQNPRGGGGKRLGAAGAGQNAKAGTGAGGGAARHATANTAEGGAGGAGEWVSFWVTGMTTATYTIGIGGAGGAAGGAKGGDGANGGAIIEEFYS